MMRAPKILLCLLALLALELGAQDLPSDQDIRSRFDLQALPPIPYPSNNQFNPDRVELGRLLFFDPLLSGEKDTACGTCHLPQFGLADGRQLGAGTSGKGLGPDRRLGFSAITGDTVIAEARHTMTIFNTGYNGDESGLPSAKGFMLWDGKDRGLEAQALRPIIVRVELRGDAYAREMAVDSVLARLRANAEYTELFEKAFPAEADSVAQQIPRHDCEWDPTPLQSVITRSTLSRALSAFEREQVTTNAPYDHYVAGDDQALNEAQKRGLVLFHTKANCSACHSGPLFSDSQFRVQGVEQIGPGQSLSTTNTGTPRPSGRDRGRFLTSGNTFELFAFRTVTLRQIELTAPYMHDGALAALEDVIEFYDRGGGDETTIDPERIDPDIFPLGLSDEEKADLLAFMTALTDRSVVVEIPERVPSGLPPPGQREGDELPPALQVAPRPASTVDSPLQALGNSPNPFNAETVISYRLERSAHVALTLYNSAGQPLRRLFDRRQRAGLHRLSWDGLDDDGRPAATGIYLAVLQAEGKTHTHRLLLLR
ncbi:MAG: T9SS type A sorting domain-containing protein [Candidatus Latescibacteria bacterium]|nr:T9SS type A sorting domain-containing protein [Candidatus Latescibacterota bacterium]